MWQDLRENEGPHPTLSLWERAKKKGDPLTKAALFNSKNSPFTEL